MSLAPADLLRKLGSGVRPVGAEAPPKPWAKDDERFGGMLRQALDAGLRTGLPVDLSNAPSIQLSSEQQQELSAAVDRLASLAAQHALVLLDEGALLTDPNQRRVTGTADLASGTPLVGIDSFTDLRQAKPPRVDQPDPERLLRALPNPPRSVPLHAKPA